MAGIMYLLGTGRVWSLAMITTFFFPFASWHSPGDPSGRSSAALTNFSSPNSG